MVVNVRGKTWERSYVSWVETISAKCYKTACISRPDNCLLSAPHLCLLPFFFLYYFLCCSLWEVSDVGVLSMST